MPVPKPQLCKNIGSYNPADLFIENGNVFSMPCTASDASVVIIPVPWEATVSYRTGTAGGPEAIRAASLQVDLYDEDMGDVWRYGMCMQPRDEDIFESGVACRSKAGALLEALGRGEDGQKFSVQYASIEKDFDALYSRIESEVFKLLEAGKIAGIAGGDHSVTLGSLRAYARRVGSFGILHIDAHADLRQSYEGFAYSHASIMYNALGLPQVERIVQVGVRDYCAEETDLIKNTGNRVRLFSDAALKKALFSGKTWDSLCAEIADSLPQYVYISFDIDGLDPSLCPGTGTPVPGGLSWHEALYLLKKIAGSGQKIIGFDLVEVAGSDGADSWDAIVGARLLYQLCGRAILSCI